MSVAFTHTRGTTWAFYVMSRTLYVVSGLYGVYILMIDYETIIHTIFSLSYCSELICGVLKVNTSVNKYTFETTQAFYGMFRTMYGVSGLYGVCKLTINK